VIPKRAKFDKARAAVLAARNARDEQRGALERKWQDPRWAPAGERAKLERLRRAYDRASARMHSLLATGPRDWARGVPSYWVVEQLTYDDAFRPTSEPLSVEPPRAWGY
jgi:hypothetical protein